jgi:biotin carboxylase
MNVVFLSPHFPPNYYPFCVHLKGLGANVLGIADEQFGLIRPELQASLTEYYRVDDLHSYDQLLRALGYFTHSYGKIDRLDSHNEYWLETEARLRTDFNIQGLKTHQMGAIKRKSKMKCVFQKARVEVARGRIVRTPEEGRALVGETGFPVVAKPDIGVGAAATYRINNLSQLTRVFTEKPAVDYFMEEFVQGQVVSFDGLVDADGRPVFYTAHAFSTGVMEAVNQNQDMFYYSFREIPEDLEAAGLSTLKAFELRERFFHFEYFRTPDDRLVALEVNVRPPGGLTTDMFNYANDIDVYAGWAQMIVHGTADLSTQRPYHVAYVGRKWTRRYAHTHEAVLDACGEYLCHHQPIEGVFAPAIGNYGYILRGADLDDLMELAEFIQRVSG